VDANAARRPRNRRADIRVARVVDRTRGARGLNQSNDVWHERKGIDAQLHAQRQDEPGDADLKRAYHACVVIGQRLASGELALQLRDARLQQRLWPLGASAGSVSPRDQREHMGPRGREPSPAARTGPLFMTAQARDGVRIDPAQLRDGTLINFVSDCFEASDWAGKRARLKIQSTVYIQ
jgi:hypothetical protein